MCFTGENRSELHDWDKYCYTPIYLDMDIREGIVKRS